MHTPHWITTASLTVLTLLSIAASVLSGIWLVRPKAGRALRKTQYSLIGLCTLGSMALFVYRATWVHHGWQPLKAHVDGLLLIATLLAVMVLYLQSRTKVRGLVPFALPVVSLILAWSVCASAWTFHPFQIDSVWMTVHLAGVYLGTLFFAIAAVAGGMFLYVQRALRRKENLRGGRRMASLETTESLIISTTTSGFGFLTIGLITGFIIQISSYSSWATADWQFWSKVLLACSAWVIYAIVMNVKHAVLFRGSRAAWLSIAGLVLLLMTFAVATAIPKSSSTITAGYRGGSADLCHASRLKPTGPALEQGGRR